MNFDIAEFGAAYAYTFDGGEAGTLETENFNAATAVVTVEGVGVHPGLAKNKMVNSLRYAAKFMEMLPPDVSPECTEVREGFIHPDMMQGNVVKTVIRILVRDHDKALFEEKKELLRRVVAKMGSCALRTKRPDSPRLKSRSAAAPTVRVFPPSAFPARTSLRAA